jgi:hypothetical protein
MKYCLAMASHQDDCTGYQPSVNSVLQAEYARLAGMSLAELTAAMQLYLPIVRTFVVLGNVVPSLRERLIQRIEAGLRSED